MWKTSLLAAWLIGSVAAVPVMHAQEPRAQPSDEEDALFAFFAGLAGAEWHARGAWAGGGTFEQVQRVEMALEGRLVKVQTLGPDGDTGDLVVRNEGVRAWDEPAGEMRFWEFDRFGGITTGRVGLHDEALHYEYTYPVDGTPRTLRDEWRPREDGAYDFQVGVWEDGAWQQTFLQATFRKSSDTRTRTRPPGSGSPDQRR